MKIADMNWMDVEAYLGRDNRAVLPLGSCEQHAYLSLAVDAILSERVALEAAEPLGIPVFPVVPYGLTPYFGAFPGTVSLSPQTYFGLVSDILSAIAHHGFRNILMVNGHGGNSPVQAAVAQWLSDHPGIRVRVHNWWSAEKTMATVKAIDPAASHASWMENFPWTRLPGKDLPEGIKAMVDIAHLRELGPQEVRLALGDGSYGGRYFREDREMMRIWQAGVLETREQLEAPWD